jgi:hypothetical protein
LLTTSLNMLEISIIFYSLRELSQIRPFLPKATSNCTHFPTRWSRFCWMNWCLKDGNQNRNPSLSSPNSFVFWLGKPLLMQLSCPPVCLLYWSTRQKTTAPIFKFGLLLLVTPSNYSPPSVASNGAPMSTTKLSDVLIFMIPITKSFRVGKYWIGKLVRVVASVLVETHGNPEKRAVNPFWVRR